MAQLTASNISDPPQRELASVAPGGHERAQPLDGLEADLVGHAGERLALVERLAVAVEAAVVVAAKVEAVVSLPVSRPLASGTRARIPTCRFHACAKSSSAGLRRNMLKMIWTVCTCGWRIARCASSTVSTLTP